eukprot:7300660-Prorocentrum_lima.AAC.1
MQGPIGRRPLHDAATLPQGADKLLPVRVDAAGLAYFRGLLFVLAQPKELGAGKPLEHSHGDVENRELLCEHSL